MASHETPGPGDGVGAKSEEKHGYGNADEGQALACYSCESIGDFSRASQAGNTYAYNGPLLTKTLQYDRECVGQIGPRHGAAVWSGRRAGRSFLQAWSHVRTRYLTEAASHEGRLLYALHREEVLGPSKIGIRPPTGGSHPYRRVPPLVLYGASQPTYGPMPIHGPRWPLTPLQAGQSQARQRPSWLEARQPVGT